MMDVANFGVTKPPPWTTLLGKKPKRERNAPLHLVPGVIGALRISEVSRLPMSQEHRGALGTAMRWIGPSTAYEAIAANIRHIQRRARNSMQQQTIKRLFDARKIVTAPEHGPSCMCNCMEVQEEREDGTRLRPIMEPLLNDLFSKNPADVLFTTTKYTTKDSIRRGVMRFNYAVQYDFRAWFDQISLDPEIRHFFGITATTVAAVLPMGFRPSCEVAEALTEGIADLTTCRSDERFSAESCGTATCVDNVLFQTLDKETAQAAGATFIGRCAQVNAILKSPTVDVVTDYDFLGEHYNHEHRTRSLTEKTALKCGLAVYLLKTRQTFTLRQVMAIVGLMLYAASTLNITVGTYHEAMRFVATHENRWRANATLNTLDAKIHLPPQVREQLGAWATQAEANKPVPAHQGECEVSLTMFTDASAEGYGAICISSTGEIKTLSRRWSVDELSRINTASSVETEPMGLIKAVAYFVPQGVTKVVIYTDHEPLVWCYTKTFGRTKSYSHMCEFLGAYNVEFVLRFVPGYLNPADTLSRFVPPPPLLQVTRVGHQHLHGQQQG